MSINFRGLANMVPFKYLRKNRLLDIFSIFFYTYVNISDVFLYNHFVFYNCAIYYFRRKYTTIFFHRTFAASQLLDGYIKRALKRKVLRKQDHIKLFS